MVVLDHDQTRRRYQRLRPKAELFVSFESFVIRTSDRAFTDFSRETARKILTERSPWVVELANLDKLSGLERALESLWRRIPPYVLIIPVQEVVPHQAVFVGLKTAPDAEVMASILITASRYIQCESVSELEFGQKHANWFDHPSPTLVLERDHGRPYLNGAAKRLLGQEHFVDLESILGAAAFRQFMKITHESQSRNNQKLSFYYQCTSAFKRKIEAIVSLQSDRVSLILTDLGIPQVKEPASGLSDIPDQRIWLKSSKVPPILLTKRPVTTVGRGPQNDLVLKDPGVSRQHAKLKWRKGRLFIEDNGSSNGVFVNGVRRTQAPVKLNDEVAIGPFKFQVLTQEDIVPSASLSGESRPIVPVVGAPLGAVGEELLVANVGSGGSKAEAVEEAREAPLLAGSLEHFSFLTLARLFELTERSGLLRMSNLAGLAEVLFSRGKLVDLRYGEQRGTKLLEMLLLWNNGEFKFYARDPDVAREKLNDSRTLSELTGILEFPNSDESSVLLDSQAGVRGG